MRLPISWLGEFTEVKHSAAKVASLFLEHGFEAELIGHDLLEVEVTYNRGDCLSVVGLAREYAAWQGRALSLPRSAALETGHPGAHLGLDEELFERYLGAEISQPKFRLPKFVAERLKLLDYRPIHPVVDVTNYVMWETGVPLHAFDLDRILPRIELRLSEPGETIVLLDGRTVGPPAGSLVFAKATTLVDLIGIMGGELSSVIPASHRFWLQAGTFPKDRIYRTSAELRLVTPAAFRFSRGVDGLMLDFALGRAGQLLGLPNLQIFSAGRTVNPLVIPLNVKRLSAILGLKISEETIREKLRALGFTIESERGSGERRTLLVAVPNHRQHDISVEEDLYEEVLRLVGYQKLPMKTLPKSEPRIPERSQLEAIVTPSRPSLLYERKELLRENLRRFDFTEVISSSFVSGSEIGAAGLPIHRAVKLKAPPSPQYGFVRPSLLIGLSRAIAENPWAADVRLFEIGRVADGDAERETLGLALSGDGRGELKSLVGLTGLHLLPTDHPLARFLKLRRTVTIAELPTGELPARLFEPVERPGYRLGLRRPLSGFPPAVRDISLVVLATLNDEEFGDSLYRQIPELALVERFDRFTSPEFGKDRESRAYHLVFDHQARTLETAEVDRIMARIVRKLTTKFKAVVR